MIPPRNTKYYQDLLTPAQYQDYKRISVQVQHVLFTSTQPSGVTIQLGRVGPEVVEMLRIELKEAFWDMEIVTILDGVTIKVKVAR